jgi:hypothetical protein
MNNFVKILIYNAAKIGHFIVVVCLLLQQKYRPQCYPTNWPLYYALTYLTGLCIERLGCSGIFKTHSMD